MTLLAIVAHIQVKVKHCVRGSYHYEFCSCISYSWHAPTFKGTLSTDTTWPGQCRLSNCVASLPLVSHFPYGGHGSSVQFFTVVNDAVSSPRKENSMWKLIILLQDGCSDLFSFPQSPWGSVFSSARCAPYLSFYNDWLASLLDESCFIDNREQRLCMSDSYSQYSYQC